MCKSKTKTMRGLLGLSVLAAFAGMGQVAYGQGGCQMSSGPATPNPVIVGQTITITFTIQNTSPNTVNAGDCKFEDVGPGDTISGVFGCGTNVAGTASQLCPTAALDLGPPLIFSLPGGNLTGAGACSGTTFAMSAPDSNGQVTFTASGTFRLTSVNYSGAPCTFTFSSTVNRKPTKDSQSGQTGLQTNSFGFAFGTGYDTTGTAGVIASGNLISSINGGGGATTTVQSCELDLDKQVSCDNGATWVDVTGLNSESNPDDPTGGLVKFCTGNYAALNISASIIKIRYVVKNIGDVQFDSCFIPMNGTGALTDTNAFFNPAGAAVTTPILAGGLQSINPLNPALACAKTYGTNGDQALDSLEPDTASITCACHGLPNDGVPEDNPTSWRTATDDANFNCQQPGLEVSKTCTPPDASGQSTVTVTASVPAGNAALTDCTVTDVINKDNTTCTTTIPPGTSLSLLPSGLFNVNPGSSIDHSLTANLGLTSDSCNTGSVTCTVANSGGATITNSDTATCTPPGAGCITRTPGFWATHPTITNDFLPLTSCGILMTVANDLALHNGSAIEDLCSIGTDNKKVPTSPQEMQLVRQCMAANLNIAANLELGGSCSTVVAGLDSLMNRCCNTPTSTCEVGSTPSAINLSGCITDLDAFNNLEDTFASGLPNGSGVFAHPGKADPSICQDSKNNGFVNTGGTRVYGPAK